MAWDQSRPVPWKRLLIFEAIYVGLFVVFVLMFSGDKAASAAVSIVLAIAVTTVVLYALIKFGYQPNWLKSRAELAQIRYDKVAARQALKAEKRAEKRGEPVRTVEVRDRPAPTRRTSTGPSNRPRRTRDNRKR